MISDNDPQFISEMFEHLSNRLGIQHMKTVAYRLQVNRTEHVNSDLVQMIASYVNNNHETWDQFLREFTYAIRTETTGKTPAELFLGRKLITPFQKLVMVSEGNRVCSRKYYEARRNTKTKHEKCAKYYNNRRREVQIKVCGLDQIGHKTIRIAGQVKGKVTGLKEDQGSGGPKRKRGKISIKQRDKRRLPSSTNSINNFRKKARRGEAAMPQHDTGRNNLRPRKTEITESRPSSELIKSQGGPVQSRRKRDQQYRPYYKDQGGKQQSTS
ncbi:uncharacterized protein TNCV_4112781 [Trichonephila clavipes]|nr:uncharacterized protein TNCV_4112781 [Trichonephila clavipes]